VVIGVVKDMIMESPYQPTMQTIFYLGDASFDDIVVRINPAMNAHNALSKIGAIFKKYSPAVPFAYKFVDENFSKKFDNEERIGKLASVFTALAIFISCLGLFGLASFMAEQRTKEIGVRKVLGASVFGVWALLSKEFVMVILLALLIAAPLAYYFMHSWLQHFQYRTSFSWWIFVVTGFGALFITVLTVSFQSFRAANANPVISLRSE
jgi:ABC-type antimicrobial peptide transport system permease subunit